MRQAVPALSVVVTLVLWQLLGANINPVLFATPSDVASAFVQISLQGILAPAFVRAMLVLLIGFSLAAVVGIAIGILMGRSATADRALVPYIGFFQATPMIGLLPLFVIWFGIDIPAEVAVVFMLSLWSIIINTAEGVHNTPANLLDMAKIYHLSERSVTWSIAIPYAVPYIFSGLRVAIGKALIGVVIAEMEISLQGLGGLVTNYGDEFKTAPLMAVIVTSSVVGYLGSAGLDLLRARLVPWAANERGRQS